MNSAMVAWAQKALRETEQRILDRNLPKQKRDRALGELAKIAYYMLEEAE